MALQPGVYLPPDDDRQNLQVAGGCSSLLHHLWSLCLSFYLYVGFEVRSPSSPDLGLRFPVFILCLVGGLFHPWNFKDYDYQFSSPEQWNDWAFSSLSQILASSKIGWLQSSPKDDSGVFSFRFSSISPRQVPGTHRISFRDLSSLSRASCYWFLQSSSTSCSTSASPLSFTGCRVCVCLWRYLEASTISFLQRTLQSALTVGEIFCNPDRG